MAKRVLVIGSGGREHALAWKLAASSEVGEVYVAPGNDGMVDVANVVPVNGADGWRDLVARERFDLVVVGPEDPLVAGLADALRADGHPVFGPSAAAARLEGDKAFAKEFLDAAGIETARARTFDNLASAFDHLKANPGPCVVKAVGLAAGKGVTVCDDSAHAAEALRDILESRVFGDAGRRVLIEERLQGPELSVFAALDGKKACWFGASRDHKRLLDDDGGPNTGGMGAFTPVADATARLNDEVVEAVLMPSMFELRRRDLDFRGLLYLGLMLTEDGPKVLEYNVRFGDPETQVVLPAFDGDLYSVLEGAAHGSLSVEGALPTAGSAVGIVLASEGYPVAPLKGRPIHGLDELPDEAVVFHAGTRREGDVWTTAGGRVLCVVGRGEDVAGAREKAMAYAETIRFEGAQRRTDIGSKEVAS